MRRRRTAYAQEMNSALLGNPAAIGPIATARNLAFPFVLCRFAHRLPSHVRGCVRPSADERHDMILVAGAWAGRQLRYGQGCVSWNSRLTEAERCSLAQGGD